MNEKLTLNEKVVILTTLESMVPVGIMLKERISSLYTADEISITLRDKLLAQGLIKKITQEVVETTSEEIEEIEEVEEVEEVKPTLHEINIQILELEGIEKAFNTIEYSRGVETNTRRISVSADPFVVIGLTKRMCCIIDNL